MNYFDTNTAEDRLEAQRSAFDRARARRRSFAPSSSYGSEVNSSFNPFNNKFSDSLFRYKGARDVYEQDAAEDWQEAYAKDEHDFALDAQKRGFALQERTSEIAKKAQEDAQRKAQSRQRTSGLLNLVSSAASFIPGVGPLLSSAIDAGQGFV